MDRNLKHRMTLTTESMIVLNQKYKRFSKNLRLLKGLQWKALQDCQMKI